MPGKAFTAALAVALALSCGAPVAAITVQPLSFAELVDQSATVVYARVVDVQGQWTANRQAIESVVTLDVIDRLKGEPGARLTFVTPGGRAGRYLNVLPGAPAFAPGELVVVFLASRGARLPVATGFTQGIYRARVDPGTGAVTVTPPLADPAVPGRIVRGDVSRRPMTLQAFGSAVRQAGR